MSNVDAVDNCAQVTPLSSDRNTPSTPIPYETDDRKRREEFFGSTAMRVALTLPRLEATSANVSPPSVLRHSGVIERAMAYANRGSVTSNVIASTEAVLRPAGPVVHVDPPFVEIFSPRPCMPARTIF